jgi:hypothetical protein
VHLRNAPSPGHSTSDPDDDHRRESASSDTSAYTNSHLTQPSMSASAQLGRTLSGKSRTLKSSKSFEHLNGSSSTQQRQATRSALDTVRRPSNASSLNLVASAKAPTSQIIASPIRKGSADTNPIQGTFADRHRAPHPGHNSELLLPPTHHHPLAPGSITSTSSLPPSPTTPTSPMPHAHAQPQPQRRSAPPPPKRRKPPAIPAGRTNGGATITTIRSSSGSSPLAMTTKMSGP